MVIKRRGPHMYEMQGPRPARSHGEPIAQLLSAPRPPPLPDAYPRRRFPGSPAVPGSPRVCLRLAAVMNFYSLSLTRHKGFRQGVSRFFGHPQDIYHYPPRFEVFPPHRPQGYPQAGHRTAAGFAGCSP